MRMFTYTRRTKAARASTYLRICVQLASHNVKTAADYLKTYKTAKKWRDELSK